MEVLEERRLLAPITEFSAGITANSSPGSITVGADGNLWFTEFGNHGVARITPSGTVTEFRVIPSLNFGPYDVTSGPGGRLSFTQAGEIDSLNPLAGSSAAIMASLTRSGTIALAAGAGITAGPDGNLWATENNFFTHVGKIAKVTPDLATVTEYPIPTSGAQPIRITAGPDGALWFIEQITDQIGRITTSGTITEFPLPTKIDPSGITAGPDGAVWFTQGGADRVGRITTSGSITLFPLASRSGPAGITAGPDGNLWFTEAGSNKIGRITPAGVVTEYGTGIAPQSNLDGIVTGPDGNLWFTEESANRIGRLVPDAPLTATGVSLSAAAGSSLSGTVASFTDGDTTAVPADFAVTIDWGDGTPVDTTGTVAAVAGQPGHFTVSGSHTYAAVGNDTATVAITDTNTTTSVGLSTATATDPVLFTSTLQFSAPGYSVNESDGSVTVTLTRVGGSRGAVSAQFRTGDGTATAGTDYTAVTQTVSWADGDLSPKTVAVPILDPGLATGQRTVNLTLSGPTGTASLGSPAVALLTIRDNDAPPAVTSATGTTFTVGAAGSFMVSATGFPVPTLGEGGDPLPGGVSFDPTTGLLSGTPAAGSGRTYTLHFTAHNGEGSDATQTFTLTVDQPAAITSAGGTTFTVGTAGAFAVAATGFPTPALSEDRGDTLPGGVAFNPATGELTGTPTPGGGGTYPLHFTAHNGVGPDATQAYTLTVVQAPAFTTPAGTPFVVGAAGSFTVAAGGSPPPALSEAPGDAPLPGGVRFDAATGLLSGTPAAGAGGTYTLHFLAANSAGSAAQTFTLTVNEPPAFTTPNAVTFIVGIPGGTRVAATGFPIPTLSAAPRETLPQGLSFDPAVGEVGGAALGLLEGTAAAGSSGVYTVHFAATNGVGAGAVQAFTLTVDEAPAFASASGAAFTAGSPGAFQVSAIGFPAPTVSETGALPAGVTFDPTTGALGGTPGPGSSGTYAVTFTARNGIGNPVSQSFVLAVNPLPITGPLNLTGLVSVNPGSPTPVGKRRRSGGNFQQTVTVTNKGLAAIEGPIALVLEDLAPRKRVRRGFVPQVVVAGAGVTRAVVPGSPFVLGPSVLPAGGTATFRLSFRLKGRGAITFNPVLLAGYPQP